MRIAKDTLIGLKWDPPPAEYIPEVFQGYHTFYREKGSKDFIQSDTDSTLATQRDIKNLKPGTGYTFKVSAVSNGQIGPFSDEINVTTTKG